MKRILVTVLTGTLAVTTLTACYGTFPLTRKIYRVNGDVKDKFLRSALTWAFAIVPVYGLAALADFIAFNTIEFWSGNNPVAVGEKTFRYVKGDERFDIRARKQEETLSYTIHHYYQGGYVDALTVRWDMRTGATTALHRQANGTTALETGRADDEMALASGAKKQPAREMQRLAQQR